METLAMMQMTKDEETFLYRVLQEYRRTMFVMGTDGSHVGELTRAFGYAMTDAVDAELGKRTRAEFQKSVVGVAAAAMALHLNGDIRYPGTRKHVP
jgi:hypothetical protein